MRRRLRLLDLYCGVGGAGKGAVEKAGGEQVKPLTRQHFVILAGLASGRTQTQLAGDLHIARSTVCAHVRAICDRLGALTPAQAVSIAWHAGILTAAALEKFRPAPPRAAGDSPEVIARRQAELVEALRGDLDRPGRIPRQRRGGR